MNSTKQKLLRLLELYPSELLGDAFPLESGGKKEALVANAVKADEEDIGKFAAKHFPITRQHVYLFANPTGKLPITKDAPILTGKLVSAALKQGEITQFYLAEETIEFLVEDGDEISRENLVLLWPVQIQLTKDYMLVRCTILERDLRTIFTDKRVIGQGKKLKDDAGIIAEAFKSMKINVPWARLDLNKAIKDLWHRDVIDALAVRFKQARSTSAEDMDVDCTLKKHYLSRYKELITRPIHGCTFIFLNEQEKYGRGFYCHPTDGLIRFTRYCRGVESTDYVLGTILELNF